MGVSFILIYTMKKKDAKVTVEVTIGESTLVEMVNSGHTPSTLIPKLVEEAWAGLRDPDEGPIVVSRVDWEEEEFYEYMDALLLEGEDYMIDDGYSRGFEEVADLISLLLAYWKLGSKPTSGELMNCLAFNPGDEWHTFLRTAKLRLTVRARRIAKPALFEQPHGSGLDRVHPMKAENYLWLERWVTSNINGDASADSPHEVERLPKRLQMFEMPLPRPSTIHSIT